MCRASDFFHDIDISLHTSSKTINASHPCPANINNAQSTQYIPPPAPGILDGLISHPSSSLLSDAFNNIMLLKRRVQ
jgi:hypothetical protein